ncbi:hypothetical protein ACWTU6_27435 [Mesorhizobium sp. BHbsci]
MACDASLPPASSPIAILFTDRFINEESGEAWPGVGLLADLLGIKSVRTVQTALQSMSTLGHITIKPTAGGKGQTNRYVPILKAKPCNNLQGLELGDAQGHPHLTCKNTTSNPAKICFQAPQELAPESL